MYTKSSVAKAALLGILLSMNSTMVFSSSDSDSGSGSDSDSGMNSGNGVHPVPEPSTLALVFAGVVAAGVVTWRKKRKKK